MTPIASARPTAPEPFWNRLPKILLYPAQTTTLVMLVVLTLGSLAAYVPGRIGFVVSVFVFLTTYKYAFEILRNTADGVMTPPLDVLNLGTGAVWRMIALLVIYGAAVFVALYIGGVPVALGVLALAALMQPGCMMSLAIDGSLLRALNPLVPLEVMRRIGWPYLAAFALLFVIQASAGTASSWIGEAMPLMGPLLVNFLSIWALFATFHLMGYLVYQYHDELGYEPMGLPETPAALDTPDTRLLAEAETLVRDGNIDTAIELLRSEARTRAIGLEAHELYHRLLVQSGRHEAMAEHARQYLHMLLMEKQERRALGLVRSALDAQPDFTPMHSEQISRIAQRARDAGQSQLAADVLRAGLRRYPQDAQAPQWGLDAAMLLIDRLGRDAEARPLLDDAQARCQDATLLKRIEAAQQLLNALPA